MDTNSLIICNALVAASALPCFFKSNVLPLPTETAQTCDGCALGYYLETPPETPSSILSSLLPGDEEDDDEEDKVKGVCRPAPIGTYVDTLGADSSTNCPRYYTTESIASHNASQCLGESLCILALLSFSIISKILAGLTVSLDFIHHCFSPATKSALVVLAKPAEIPQICYVVPNRIYQFDGRTVRFDSNGTILLFNSTIGAQDYSLSAKYDGELTEIELKITTPEMGRTDRYTLTSDWRYYVSDVTPYSA